jgi:hypothetical protein
MRSVFHSQLNLGEEDIAKIKLDPKSRDDIPQLLAGLQYIYTHADVRQGVFKNILRLSSQGTGYGHPFLHTAGQLGRVEIQGRFHPYKT